MPRGRGFRGFRSKNLLKNPSAKDGLKEWQIVEEGGNGFKCENPPVGCKAICDCTRVKENLPCWATSYFPCMKVQIVDLMEGGISENQLDVKKLPITVRDWYCSRFDCGCKYTMVARLLNNDKEELDKWEFTDDLDKDADWKRARRIFKDYPKGVRYVEVRHGGVDLAGWAGHYGVKMTNTGVYVGVKRKHSLELAVQAAAGKTLLKNPWGKEGLSGWEVTSNGGDGFLTEEKAAGCTPLSEFNDDAEGSSCWATSHRDCEKTQMIHLGSVGFDDEFMDVIKPEIKVSEWVGTRPNAGGFYWLRVQLLNRDLKELASREVKEARDATGEWSEVSQSFSDYAEGVRFIKFTHGGRDNCSWAGHYGAKFTGSSVKIVLEEGSSSSSTASASSSSDDER